MTALDSLDEVREHLKAYVKTLPAGHVRYENLPPDSTYDPKYDMDREKDRGVGEEGLARRSAKCSPLSPPVSAR